ncbi:MAG: hypothetical protein ACOX0A_07970 [Thermoguttaceae bacterium]|jgi:negative regulator of flagellin synthesis FlgM
MNINGINGIRGVAPVRQTGATNKNSAAKNVVEKKDVMDVEKQGAINSVSRDTGEIRLDLVNRVRAEIAAGTYYTDEKLEIALSRMFDSFE